MQQSTSDSRAPLAESSTIVLVGMRNAGKSSLINTLFERDVAIVSPEAGTTTDPVTRKMELPGWGAVAFVDTAGLDDEGSLGQSRVARTRERLAQAAAALFVSPRHTPPLPEERALLDTLKAGGLPFLVALTHADLPANAGKRELVKGLPCVELDCRAFSGAGAQDAASGNPVAAKTAAGELRVALAALSPLAKKEETPLEGLVSPGDHILLVMPQDRAAPRGRLLLPQAETVRDALDRRVLATSVTTEDLPAALALLKAPPSLVITDSQVFGRVAELLPADQPLTSFSIIFARKKGELPALVEGLSALDSFRDGGRVFVFESCAHHRTEDDIASVKIPRLFRAKTGKDAVFSTVRQVPPELSKDDLVIHCAACMTSSAAFRARMAQFREIGVPVTNFGVFLAWANGLFPRALEPLPEFSPAAAPRL